jgi:hypothetical protein
MIILACRQKPGIGATKSPCEKAEHKKKLHGRPCRHSQHPSTRILKRQTDFSVFIVVPSPIASYPKGIRFLAFIIAVPVSEMDSLSW